MLNKDILYMMQSKEKENGSAVVFIVLMQVCECECVQMCASIGDKGGAWGVDKGCRERYADRVCGITWRLE